MYCVLAPGILAAQDTPLPRRAALGASVAQVTDSVRLAHRLDATSGGMVIVSVVPGGTAAAAGLRPGDLVLAVNGQRVVTQAATLAALRQVGAGQAAQIAISRGGEARAVRAIMQPRPLERTDRWVTIAAEVSAAGRRQRVLITRPSRPGRFPVLLVMGGIGGYSLDGPLDAIHYGPVFRTFADSGWVTVRVDKPGQGDSEGGPITELLFEDELAGYRAALASLGGFDFVDTTRILLFGHSMGGVFAPLLAAEHRVAGVAVYGTVARTWIEYVLDTSRGQLALGGASPDVIEQALEALASATQYAIAEGWSLERLARERPDLTEFVEANFPNGTFSGMGLRYFTQLHAHNLGRAWGAVDAPVLALAGAADFVASPEDHVLIADYVNRVHPGRAEFRLLPGIDHSLLQRGSREESFAAAPGAPFNRIVLGVLFEWTTGVTRAGGSR